MKVNALPRRRDDDENLIPLINIVFLLLIFFMLAGTFARPDRFEVAPPSSLSPTPAQEQQMTVLLSADGRLAIGDQEVDKPELQRLIMDRLSAEPDLQVQLKADQNLAAEKLIDIMESLRAAGLEKLMLLTVLDEG